MPINLKLLYQLVNKREGVWRNVVLEEVQTTQKHSELNMFYNIGENLKLI